MHLLNKSLSISVLLILSLILGTTALAQGKTSSDNRSFMGLFKSVYLHGDAGYKLTSWEPMERTEKGEILNFKTEGLHQININAILGFKDVDFLTYSYEGPIVRSDRQNEMFAVNTSQEWGLEKYTAGINFFSVADYFIPNPKPGPQFLLKVLSSVKFRYSKELVFGDATATRDFYYVPYGSGFSQYSVDLSAYQYIGKGNNIAFKTTFEDYEATIALYFWDKYEFRVGYMTSIWKRPSEYFKLLVDDTATLIFGTRYEARSLYFGVQTNQRGSAGINVDAFLRSGIFEASMENSFDEMNTYFEDEDESWLHYLGIYLDVWYNVYSKNKRFSLTIGGIYDNRTWFREYKEIDGKMDPRSGKIDIEDIFKGYINLAIQI